MAYRHMMCGWVWCVCVWCGWVVCMAGCNLSDGAPPKGNLNVPDAGDMSDACVPKTCKALGDDMCGAQKDGCGGMLDCGACPCDASNLDLHCEARPCEVVQGCAEDGSCVYEPIMCSGQQCVCPKGEDCSKGPVRCGDAMGAKICPALACNPAPMTQDGKTLYQNLCIAAPINTCDLPDGTCGPAVCNVTSCEVATCGVCGLGGWDCGGTDGAPVCVDLRLPGVSDVAMLECDDTNINSSFVFVDYDNVGGTGNGTRVNPYSTLLLAHDAVRNDPRGFIIIAGSPEIKDVKQWSIPVSIYGGFKRHGGLWSRDLGERPTFTGDETTHGDRIGLVLSGISKETTFHHLAVTSEDVDGVAHPGRSSYGLRLIDAPLVRLEDVRVTAGKGGSGVDGVAGSPGADGGAGQSASQNNPGNFGMNPLCAAAHGGRGGEGAPGIPGAPGVNAASGALGGPGAISIDRPATDGRDGALNVSMILHGKGASFSPMLDGKDFWRAQHHGVAGGHGAHGHGGGGGGAAGGHITSTGGFPPNILVYLGGGGGGGGAGGCGGAGGQGGTSAGASIALFAVRSNGATIVGGTFTAQDGVAGGTPGAPGAGGQGGAGGIGVMFQTASRGGKGGDGSPGAAGGRGGGGAGGPSYALWCGNMTHLTLEEPGTLTVGVAGASGGIMDGSEPGEAVENKGCSPAKVVNK